MMAQYTLLGTYKLPHVFLQDIFASLELDKEPLMLPVNYYFYPHSEVQNVAAQPEYKAAKNKSVAKPGSHHL